MATENQIAANHRKSQLTLVDWSLQAPAEAALKQLHARALPTPA